MEMGKTKKEANETAEIEIKEEPVENPADDTQNVSQSNAAVLGKDEYKALCQLVNPIAQPLANRRLAKKVYKLVSKSSMEKGFLRNGLTDVMKALRKNEKGIVILAGLKT